MRPFQQLRLWAQTGPRTERALTGLAAVVVVALAVWVAAPTTGFPAAGTTLSAFPDSTPTQGATAPGQVTGSVGFTPQQGSTPVGAAAAAGSVTAGGAVQGSSAGTRPGSVAAPSAGGLSTPGCLAAPSGEGISATEIKIGVALVTLGALNGAIGIPTEEEHQRAYRAVFEDYNKRGGVQCRKLVPVFYSDNILDSGSERAVCLQMQQDRVFAVINNLFNADTITCVAQAKIPNFWYTAPLTSYVKKYSPYILSYLPDSRRLIKQYVRGAREVGWFAGANKIGILENTCFPENNETIKRELTGIGYPASSWSVYNYGCTTTGTGQESEKDTAAAVQFNRDGVTHVMGVAFSKAQQFAKAAEQQQYRPKYALMSDGQIEGMDNTASGQAASFDGALNITADQIGSENTPGYRFSAATQTCRTLIKGAGLPDPIDPEAGTAGPLYGAACAQTTLLVAALKNAPALTRVALSTGLQRAGQLDVSYPAGPGQVADPALPTAGNFWRTGAFRSACNCWQVTSPGWRKQFV